MSGLEKMRRKLRTLRVGRGPEGLLGLLCLLNMVMVSILTIAAVQSCSSDYYVPGLCVKPEETSDKFVRASKQWEGAVKTRRFVKSWRGNVALQWRRKSREVNGTLMRLDKSLEMDSFRQCEIEKKWFRVVSTKTKSCGGVC